MSLTIVPFEREHLDAVMDLGDAERENLLMYDLLGRTCMDDGQPCVCMGVMRRWPGVGEAWTAARPGLERKDQAFVLRRLRSGLEEFMDEENLHRVQSIIIETDKTALRLAHVMGLEFESKAVAYDSDRNDYLRFAKVT